MFCTKFECEKHINIMSSY